MKKETGISPNVIHLQLVIKEHNQLVHGFTAQLTTCDFPRFILVMYFSKCLLQ